MARVGTLTIDVEARIAKLHDGMERAAQIAERMAKRMQDAQAEAAKKIERDWEATVNRVGAAMAVLAGAAAAIGAQALRSADEIAKAARAAGIGVEQYSALAQVAGKAGLSLGELSQAVRALNIAISMAQRGEGPAALLQALGVSVRDQAGGLRGSLDVLLDISDALARVPDPAQRAEAAVRLFGRSGTEMLVALEGGSAAIREAMDRARALGIVLTEEAAAGIERARDALEDASAALRGIFASSVGDAIGRIAQLFVSSQEMTSAASGLGSALKALSQAMLVLAYGMEVVIATSRVLIRSMQGVGEAALQVIGATTGWVSSFASRIAEAVTTDATLMQSLRAGFLDAMDRAGEGAAGAVDALSYAWSDLTTEIGPESIERLIRASEVLFATGEAASSAASSTRQLSGAKVDLSRVLAESREQAGRVSQSIARARVEQDRWRESVDRLVERIESMSVDRVAADMVQLAAAIEEATAAGDSGRVERLTEAMLRLGDSVSGELSESLRLAAASVAEYIRELEREIELVGASDAERRRLEAGLRAEEAVRRAVAGLSEDQASQLQEEIDRVRELTERLEGLRDARGATFERALLDAIEAAFAGASLEAFFRRLGDGLRRAFSRASGESPAAAAQRIAGNINQAAQFALRVAQAWRSAETDLGRVVAVAAQIRGPIGEVAQAIQAIDAIFGGRLLGTAYRTVQQRRLFALSAEGVTGRLIDVQERQRSLFRGRRRREVAIDLDPETRAQLERMLQAVEQAVGAAAAAVGARIPQIVSGQIEQRFDAQGRLLSSVATVLGRAYQEGVEEFGRRVTAESLIATLDQVLGGAADAMAERYRQSADDLLDAARAFVAIQSDIRRGLGLLRGEGEFAETVLVVEALARAGESLEEAYRRLVQASAALERGIGGLGIIVERGRDAFAAFASELADAVGGAQELEGLLGAAASLADPLAVALGRLRAAQAEVDRLGGAGLDPDALLRDLRDALLAGEADRAATLLRLADAVAAARDAEAEYLRVLEDRRARLLSYAEAVSGVELELFFEGLSGAGRAFAELRLEHRRLVEALHSEARSAGLAGARTEDLARAQELYARRVAALAARLRADAAGIVREIGLGPLGRIEAEIARLQRESSVRITAAGDAWVRAADQALSAADELRIGELSPLSYAERLEEALRLFRAAPSEQLGRQVLELARVRFATGPEYAAIFAEVEQALRGLATVDQGAAMGVAAGEVIADRLTELERERDRLMEEQARLERVARAQELAQIVATLSEITGESVRAVLDSLGVSLAELGEILGMAPDDLERWIGSQVVGIESQVDAIMDGARQIVDTLLRLPDEGAIAVWSREPGTIARIAEQQREAERAEDERHEQVMREISQIRETLDAVIARAAQETAGYTERTARATEALASGSTVR